VTLGRSGLKVSPFCLGTTTFGEDLGWAPASQTPKRSSSGIWTAEATSSTRPTVNTKGIIGGFFAQRKGKRDRVVIATKFFVKLFAGDPNGLVFESTVNLL
jgi:aryl-alcohol dehydrogenase-like predicted oxidoreductase